MPAHACRLPCPLLLLCTVPHHTTPSNPFQVAGLWIILSITTGIGIILAAVQSTQRWLRHRASGGGAHPRAGASGGIGNAIAAPVALLVPQSPVRPPAKPGFWGTTLSIKSKRPSNTGSDSDWEPTAAATPHGGGPGPLGPPSPGARRRSGNMSRLGTGVGMGGGRMRGSEVGVHGAEEVMRVETFGEEGTLPGGVPGDVGRQGEKVAGGRAGAAVHAEAEDDN